mgnify:CR=1 FL=1
MTFVYTDEAAKTFSSAVYKAEAHDSGSVKAKAVSYFRQGVICIVIFL